LRVRSGLAFLTASANDDRIGFDEVESTQVPLGADLTWQINPKLSVRADIDSYDAEESYAGLSLSWRLGKPQGTAKAAPVLVQAKPTPEPEPQKVLEPQVAKVPVSACEALPSLLTLNFRGNSAVLSDAHKQRLVALQPALNIHPEAKIEAQGHTDSRGEGLFNVGLSTRRAKAVVAFLADLGVPKSKMSAYGFGYNQPKDTNDTAEGRANNRRVEIVGLKNICK